MIVDLKLRDCFALARTLSLAPIRTFGLNFMQTCYVIGHVIVQRT